MKTVTIVSTKSTEKWTIFYDQIELKLFYFVPQVSDNILEYLST